MQTKAASCSAVGVAGWDLSDRNALMILILNTIQPKHNSSKTKHTTHAPTRIHINTTANYSVVIYVERSGSPHGNQCPVACVSLVRLMG